MREIRLHLARLTGPLTVLTCLRGTDLVGGLGDDFHATCLYDVRESQPEKCPGERAPSGCA